MRIVTAAACLFLAVLAPALAQPGAPAMAISDAWIMTPPASADVAAGYVIIRGAAADRLLSVSTSAAGRVEMHDMRVENDVMMMRALPYGVVMPAGGEVSFRPGGMHLMLVGLLRPLREGENVRLRLTFRDAGAIDADFAVRRHP